MHAPPAAEGCPLSSTSSCPPPHHMHAHTDTSVTIIITNKLIFKHHQHISPTCTLRSRQQPEGSTHKTALLSPATTLKAPPPHIPALPIHAWAKVYEWRSYVHSRLPGVESLLHSRCPADFYYEQLRSEPCDRPLWTPMGGSARPT